MPEFDRFDILALPTAQVFPFSKDVHWPESINGRQMDTYHRWMEVVVAVLSLENLKPDMFGGFQPTLRQFEVTGTFTTGMFEYDLSTVYTKVL